MYDLAAVLADAGIFVCVPWLLWRLIGRTIPIAVIPILIGILAAVWHLPLKSLGIPSFYGDTIGWIAVLVLAFTAGMEMWQHPDDGPAEGPLVKPPVPRLLGGAVIALAGPFLVGAILVYYFFLPLPGWHAPSVSPVIAAASIGLCIAVSALPVLIGIVRELPAADRPIGQLALKLAVIDDATLWIGLAVLQFAAERQTAMHSWGLREGGAALLLIALGLGGSLASRHYRNPPRLLIWAVVPLYLSLGSWASMTLGMHELIGAYFAGAFMPPSWVRRLPYEAISTFALIWVAPLFFGHSGLRINGDALTWPSVLASLSLVAISILAKMGSIYIFPPASGLSTRQTLGLGSLLQCKGLMEIVAATILHEQGMLSEFAFASLMVLAVISTLLTGPLFHLFKPRHASEA